MTNVTTLAKSRDNEPDPLRAALADALAAEREARTALDRAEQALQRGHAVVAASEANLASALRHVEVAKEGDARRTAAAVRNRPSGATPDASGVRRARLAAVEAEDDLEVSRGAVARIQEELEAARDAARWATNSVLVLRNNLLAEFAGQLLELARARRLEAKVYETALSELLNNSDVAAPEFEDAAASIRAREERTAELGALRKQAADFFMTRRTENESEAEAAAIGAIRAFAARLLADPSAPPPALLP